MEQYKPDFDANHITSGIMRPTSPTTGRRRRRLRSDSWIPIINALLSYICTSVFAMNILNMADRQRQSWKLRDVCVEDLHF